MAFDGLRLLDNSFDKLGKVSDLSDNIDVPFDGHRIVEGLFGHHMRPMGQSVDSVDNVEYSD